MSCELPSPQPEMASRADGGRPSVGEGWAHPGVWCDSHDLWSSKALNLLWLPRCDNWNDPCLHDIALPDGVSSPQAPADPRCKGVVCRWFWRVTPDFGAWAFRAIHRAGLAKADLPSGVYAAFAVLKAYLSVRHPADSWPTLEQRGLLAPMVLPAPDPTAFEMARFGLLPRWEGWGDAAAGSTPAPASSPGRAVPASPGGRIGRG